MTCLQKGLGPYDSEAPAEMEEEVGDVDEEMPGPEVHPPPSKPSKVRQPLEEGRAAFFASRGPGPTGLSFLHGLYALPLQHQVI